MTPPSDPGGVLRSSIRRQHTAEHAAVDRYLHEADLHAKVYVTCRVMGWEQDGHPTLTGVTNAVKIIDALQDLHHTNSAHTHAPPTHAQPTSAQTSAQPTSAHDENGGADLGRSARMRERDDVIRLQCGLAPD